MTSSNQQQPSVLVIAEDAALRSTLYDLVEAQGYSVSAATTGHQGMLLARKERPGLVVIGLPLRVLSAESIMSALRMQLGTDLRLLVVAPPGCSDPAMSIEASAVLVTPVASGEFSEAVRGLLDAPTRAGHSLHRRAGSQAWGRAEVARRNWRAGSP